MVAQLSELARWVRNRKFMATLLATVTLSIGILIGTVISGRVGAARPAIGMGATPLALPNPVSLSTTFSVIAERDEPAVVNISTTQVIERHGQQGEPGNQSQGRSPNNQDPFQDFFNRFFDAPDDGPEAERSLGSGMIVDPKGFILTNNHVIEQATKIQVQLNGDSTTYTAKLVGADEETDLAVIKIDANRDLPVVRLGNSDGVKVGDWVLAIGSPFGLQSTLTAGIISAVDRGGVGRQFQHFLQTDAAINPGNSGGPLVDMAGEVIGINTAIMTGGRGYEGVGFALPSAMAVGVYNQIIERGKVTRGSIGVSFTEDVSTNPIVLRELGASYGLVLNSVEPGSPAALGGLQAGDVVTAIDGRAVKTGSDLVDPIAQTPIGSTVHVTYVRDRQQHDATLTVEDRAKIFPNQATYLSDDEGNGQPPSGAVAPAELGLRVEDWVPDRAKHPEYQNYHGVVVTEVAPVSFAEDAGLQRGDLIEEINHAPVASAADYRKIMATIGPGQDVVFKVVRRGDGDRMLTLYLAGTAPR
jgi:serine protease Do